MIRQSSDYVLSYAPEVRLKLDLVAGFNDACSIGYQSHAVHAYGVTIPSWRFLPSHEASNRTAEEPSLTKSLGLKVVKYEPHLPRGAHKQFPEREIKFFPS
jgi:hypothetical protein